jgi:hypothetical protein
MREFDTGATRDNDENKLDYEGFLSPIVLERFAWYMHLHRQQADGKLRSADNWQKGMPLDVYMKSLFRHFMDLWAIHRGEEQIAINVYTEEVLCAIMFNVMGYLHTVLKAQTPDDTGQKAFASRFSSYEGRLHPGETVSGPDGRLYQGQVMVSGADLEKVLVEAAELVGGKDNAAYTRLLAAVGVQQ